MRIAPPYRELARSYNAALGLPHLREICRAFERLTRRHAIGFASAVDLGCGTGLFACYLSARFRIPVFGVDRSSAMLDVARRGCRLPAVRFLQQDVRCLRLPMTVDLATANFDTINHLTDGRDLGRTFERIRANLRAGGHFLFDLLTPWQPLAPGHTVGRRLPACDGFLDQLIRWHPRERRIDVTVVHRGPRGVTVERHHERAYSPVPVCRQLAAAGFCIREVCDARTLLATRPTSSRVIVVARRR
ncbi:MAG TPA: class I SAM-dependent methyltransferase [Vicinamibacterales bacterium]|nr:class I SAM-dependent methyltransferase [Vicinamibacterales bacterium]